MIPTLCRLHEFPQVIRHPLWLAFSIQLCLLQAEPFLYDLHLTCFDPCDTLSDLLHLRLLPFQHLQVVVYGLCE